MSQVREAFCPGHITAFFEICDQHEDPLRRGSRGVGFCLSLGAISRVTVNDSNNQELLISINGERGPASVTSDAIKYLINNKNLAIDVQTILDLPIGQGFGMSAAGSLSAVIALCDILGMPSEKAFEAAHLAEIENRTGLGDISGIYAGGMELRTEPGLPPHGQAQRLEISSEMVLAVIGEPINTNDIILDEEKRAAISSSGRRCIEAFSEDPTLDHLFALGMEFVEDAGLASMEVLKAIAAAECCGMGSMIMLGNSIFCIGKNEDLLEALKPFGSTFQCEVDQQGPRLL